MNQTLNIQGFNFPYKLKISNRGKNRITHDFDGNELFVLPGGYTATQKQIIDDYLPKARKLHRPDLYK